MVSRSLSQPIKPSIRLAATSVVLLGGCLDLLGDVNVDPIRPGTLPNFPDECTDAEVAAGTCVVSCEPGSTRCNANLLQRCNEAGDGWGLIDQCASAALCDAESALCAPPACAEREHRCTETGERQQCNADRTGFERLEQCRSAAFCSAVPGRSQCEGTACRAGRERCNGPQIEVCREDRSGYDVVGEVCASAALCFEGAADTAECTPPLCSPGVFTCDGVQLTRCSDDANSFIAIAECETAELCVAGEQRCAEPLCDVGEQRCAENVLERCNAARNGYAPVETCQSARACDPTAPTCLTDPPLTDPLPDPTVLDGPNYSFAEESSPAVIGLGPMQLRVPTQWSDVDRSAWVTAAGATIGPRFVASTDAARFMRNFDIPGVYFGATAVAPIEVAARQREFDLTGRCTAGESETYEDELYRGVVQTWSNCGVTNATTSVVVALEKDASSFVTVVIVTMVAQRDQAARRQIWDSFIAD